MAIIQPPIPLEDIVTSPAQGFWPLAPGWWLLIVLCLALIAWFFVIIYQRRQQLAFHRKQLKLLDLIEKQIRNNDIQPLEFHKILSRVYKLFLLHYAADKSITAISAEQLKSWTEERVFLSNELEFLFDQSIYKNEAELQSSQKQLLSQLVAFRKIINQLQKIFIKNNGALVC